jgi:hypothetical protein
MDARKVGGQLRVAVGRDSGQSACVPRSTRMQDLYSQWLARSHDMTELLA